MFVRVLSAVSAALLLGGAQAPDSRPELWGGLRLGMSPEEVTSVLMSREGIQRTRMGRPGRDGRTTMNVSAQRGAIEVAGQRGHIRPIFSENSLSSIEIELSSFSRRYCEPDAIQVITLLDDLLNIKYTAVVGTRPQEYTSGEVRVTPVASVSPPNDLYIESKMCAQNGKGGTTAILTLVYEGEESARSQEETDSLADQNRLREALDGI